MNQRSPVLRAPRALLAGTTCALGASIAHVLAGGVLPSAGLMALLLVATVSGAAALAGQRLTAPSLLAVALLAQGGLHAAYLLGSAGTHGDGTTMVVTHAAAALLTTTLASLGEDALWRLLDGLGLRVLRMPHTPVQPPVPARVAIAPRPPAPRGLSVWRCPTRPRRGPPAAPPHPALPA